MKKINTLKNFVIFASIVLFFGCSKNTSDMPISAKSTTYQYTVHITNSTYDPVRLQIIMGNPVTWINDDNVIHTVTANDDSFNSGDIRPGQKFTYTFSSAGTYDYHCVYHSKMAGEVVSGGIR